MDAPEGWFFNVLGIIVTIGACAIIGGTLWIILQVIGVL